jgi:hypothetical protein
VCESGDERFETELVAGVLNWRTVWEGGGGGDCNGGLVQLDAMAGARRRCQCRAVDRDQRRAADCDDCEGGQQRAHAQEELQAVRAALEADQQLVGPAQLHGSEGAPGVPRAAGASRERPAQGGRPGGELPRQELLVPRGHGLGVRHQVP